MNKLRYIILILIIFMIILLSCNENLPYTLTIQQPERGGVIEADPEPDADNTYQPNTEVTLTAILDEGFIFGEWEGHAEGTESTTTIIMNNDKIVSASFIDVKAPGEISNLTATGEDNKISFTWDNPDDDDLTTIEITHDQENGDTPIYVDAGEQTYEYEGLTNYLTYNFTFRTIDTSDNYSEGISISASPVGDLSSFNIVVNSNPDTIYEDIPFSITVNAIDNHGEFFISEQDISINLSVNTSSGVITPDTTTILEGEYSSTLDVTITEAGGAVITATIDNPSVTGSSPNINVLQGSFFNKLKLLYVPAAAIPNTDFPITIQATDQYNNPISVGDTDITIDLTVELINPSDPTPVITPTTATILANSSEIITNVNIDSPSNIKIVATHQTNSNIKGESIPIEVTNIPTLAKYLVTTDISGAIISALTPFNITVEAIDQFDNPINVTSDINIIAKSTDTNTGLLNKDIIISNGLNFETIQTSFINESSGTRIRVKDTNNVSGISSDLLTVSLANISFTEDYEDGFTPDVWGNYYTTTEEVTMNTSVLDDVKPLVPHVDDTVGYGSSAQSMKFYDDYKHSELIKTLDVQVGDGGAVLTFNYRYDKTDGSAGKFVFFDTVYTSSTLYSLAPGGVQLESTPVQTWKKVTIVIPSGKREFGWWFYNAFYESDSVWIDNVELYGDVTVLNIESEIKVYDGMVDDLNIVSLGDNLDEGAFGVDVQNPEFEFTIYNNNKDSLNISEQGSGNYINITNGPELSVIYDDFSSTIDPFSETSFKIQLDTTNETSGQVSANISIQNNDPITPDFTFNILYQIIQATPIIEVSYYKTGKISDGSTDFEIGNAFVGYSYTYDFVITNTGTSTLQLTDQGSGDYVTVNNPNYSISTQPSNSINPEESSEFSIELDITSGSDVDYVTTVTIQSNATSPSDIYTYAITANGYYPLSNLTESWEHGLDDNPWIIGYEENYSDSPTPDPLHVNISQAPHTTTSVTVNNGSVLDATDGTHFLQFGQIETDSTANDTAPIGAYDKTYVEIVVAPNNDMALIFDWLNDAEGYDYLGIYKQNLWLPVERIMGNIGTLGTWQSQQLLLTGGQNHRLRWIFKKDYQNSEYSDTAWLDNIRMIDADPSIAIKEDGFNKPYYENGVTVYDFGTIGNGQTFSADFDIENTGFADLQLTGGSPYIDFSTGSQLSIESGDEPNPTITSGGVTSFTITLNSTSVTGGVVTDTVTIPNNSPNDNPFTFYVTYEVVTPEPDIQLRYSNNLDIPNGGTFTYRVDADDNEEYIFFRVYNLGTDDLNFVEHTPGQGDYVILTPIDNAPISLYSYPLSPVNPYGDYNIFRALVTPTGTTENYSATISVKSDDPDTPLYVFTLDVEQSVNTLIDDFSLYSNGQPPTTAPTGEVWTVSSLSDYTGSEEGPIVSSGRLRLLFDQLGDDGSYGVGYTGYTYAQINFTPPANGYLEFNTYTYDYESIDLIEFWKDLNQSDIDNPTIAPDLSYPTDSSINADTHRITGLVGGQTYRLTWKVSKSTLDKEDRVEIDKIIFWETP